jgi:RNA methyltransferase, TrmH family
MAMITSTSNQHVALMRSLHIAKGREREGMFLVEGPHLVEAALDAHVTPRLILYDAENVGRSPSGRKLIGRIEEAAAHGGAVYEATAAAIERASDAQTPQGVVAAVASEDVSVQRVRARRRGRQRPLLLVLDGIGDPGNLGTIVRSALAADVDEVLLTKGCVDPLAPKVVRAGSGAHFHLPVRAGLSWDEIEQALRGSPVMQQVLMAEVGARTPYDAFDLTKRTALIIGNEAHGVSAEAKRLETAGLSIPMWNRVESLNAAIAASVVLFEAARQRRAVEQT